MELPYEIRLPVEVYRVSVGRGGGGGSVRGLVGGQLTGVNVSVETQY